MHNELEVLEQTSHPNIVAVYELLSDFQNYYIVQEYVRHGELFDFIASKQNSLKEMDAQNIIHQLFLALNYMHSQGMVHRDIKPENILISQEDPLEIKLTDFGFATYHHSQELEDIVGSPIYMAPEIVQKQPYNEMVDCWSAGVVAYVLLTGKQPFNGETKDATYKRILNSEPDFAIPELSEVSYDAIDFMKQLIGKKDPSDRMSTRDALVHPWLHTVVKKEPKDLAHVS